MPPSNNHQLFMDPARAASTLPGLPTELRRLIVSFLAPQEPKEVRRGCKTDLKNANLSSSCLRECVPEFMFRDMALPHVVVGVCSQLEYFALDPANASLLKYVRRIVIQVPPAVKWDPVSARTTPSKEVTANRLWKKFGVTDEQDLSDDQKRYCRDYHRALVEPFIDHRRWYDLRTSAEQSWRQVLRRFPNLEEVAVGCCKRVDQPSPTYTNAFILQHGASVVENDVEPAFVEISSVNMAWASSVILRSAPRTIKSLRLCMANVDNLNSFSTINRLFMISHPTLNDLTILHPQSVTKLCVTIEGLTGTHGSSGTTGTTGQVRHWQKVLKSLKNLAYLEFQDELSYDSEMAFENFMVTDKMGSVLDLLLPGLALDQLSTLHICGFLIPADTFPKTFSTRWPRFMRLILDDVRLMKIVNRARHSNEYEQLRHIQGGSWADICVAALGHYPHLQIEINQPTSNINDNLHYKLHAKYADQLRLYPTTTLDLSGPYKHPVTPPANNMNSELSAELTALLAENIY